MSESRVVSITTLQPSAYPLPALPRSEQISDLDLFIPTRGSASLLDWDLDVEPVPYRTASAGAVKISA